MSKFKAFLLVIGASLACTVMVHAGDTYSGGWRCGWEAGWKQIKGQYSFAPYAPYAPFPPLGCDDYSSGFAAGAIAGAPAAEED
jgi:hypothetical protein